jgi:hypothetical protein
MMTGLVRKNKTGRNKSFTRDPEVPNRTDIAIFRNVYIRIEHVLRFPTVYGTLTSDRSS